MTMANAWVGSSKTGKTEKGFCIPFKNLKKHFIALGSSGSGKTVMCKVILEEAARNNIPCIIIDPQGDLASLAIKAQFKDIEEKGISKDVYDSLNTRNIKIYTPASNKGIPISIDPFASKNSSQIATSIARLLGYDLDNDQGKAAETVIYLILEKVGVKDFDELMDVLENPPNRDEIYDLMKDSEITTLIKRIKFLTIGKKSPLFTTGRPLSIDELAKNSMSIIYLNTLDSYEDKEFFVSMISMQLYDWMLKNPKPELQLLYFIDEAAPFLPAGSEKPATKPILSLLYKQARKYGVGCMLATQNPGDIDYKSFAQFGTWAIGRLTTKQDQKKVMNALKSLTSKDLSTQLPKLQPGEFLLFSPDTSKDIVELRTRWLITEHKTLTEDDIAELMHANKASAAKRDANKTAAKELKKSEITADEKDEATEKKKGMPIFPLLIDNIQEFAEKNKKRSLLVGPKKESIASISLELNPVTKATVRVREKKLFKQVFNEYELLFDSDSSLFINLEPRREFAKIADLNASEMKVMRHLIEKRKDVVAMETATQLGFSAGFVTQTLNSLLDKKLASHNKVGKEYLWFPLIDAETKIRKAQTKNIDIETREMEGKILKTNASANKMANLVRNWFDDAEIVKEETIYIPIYSIKYVSKKGARTLKVNASSGEIMQK